MTPDEVRAAIDPVTRVARDLTEIATLAAMLAPQAIAKANDRVIVGGEAMVLRAGEANLDQWAELIAFAELRHIADPIRYPYPEHVADEDDQEHEDPLRTLLFWSEAWREEHGFPLEGRTPTLVTEAGVIRHMLNWAWENEPHWDDMARDINRARRRLEDVLHAGRRANRTRVPCDRGFCERKPRLIRVHAETQEQDHFKCPSCKTRYTPEDFARALGRQLRSEGSERYVSKATAVAVLAGLGRSERTIRQWFTDGKVQTADDEARGIRYVWWPDLWRLHNATRTRQRSA